MRDGQLKPRAGNKGHGSLTLTLELLWLQAPQAEEKREEGSDWLYSGT